VIVYGQIYIFISIIIRNTYCKYYNSSSDYKNIGGRILWETQQHLDITKNSTTFALHIVYPRIGGNERAKCYTCHLLLILNGANSLAPDIDPTKCIICLQRERVFWRGMQTNAAFLPC
jgi:hypothetical protein